MAKATPTTYDSNVVSEIPTLEPEKRVGGGEYVKEVTDTKEVTKTSGIVSKALDAINVKSLSEHKAAAAAKKAAKEQSEGGETTSADTSGTPTLYPAPISPYNRSSVTTQTTVSKVDAALGKTTNGKLSSGDDFFSLENNPILKSLRPSDVKDVLTDENGDLTVDQQALFDKSMSSMGLNSLKNSLTKGEISELMSLAGEYATAMSYNGVGDAFEYLGQITDGVGKYINADTGSSEGLLGMLNVITGNEDIMTYTDIGGEASFIHALTQKAIDWDLGEYIDKLTGSYYNTTTQQTSIQISLSRAAAAGRYDRWSELYAKLEDSRKAKLKDKHLKELVMYFSIDSDDVLKDKIAKLIGCMNSIDSSWDKNPSNGLPYLYYYSYASRDAVSGFCLIEERLPYALAGYRSKYKSSSAIMSSTFPITSWY